NNLPYSVEKIVSGIFPSYDQLYFLSQHGLLNFHNYEKIAATEFRIFTSELKTLVANDLLNQEVLDKILSSNPPTSRLDDIVSIMHINALKLILDDFEKRNTNVVTRHLDDDFVIYSKLKNLYERLPAKNPVQNRKL